MHRRPQSRYCPDYRTFSQQRRLRIPDSRTRPYARVEPPDAPRGRAPSADGAAACPPAACPVNNVTGHASASVRTVPTRPLRTSADMRALCPCSHPQPLHLVLNDLRTHHVSLFEQRHRPLTTTCSRHPNGASGAARRLGPPTAHDRPVHPATAAERKEH